MTSSLFDEDNCTTSLGHFLHSYLNLRTFFVTENSVGTNVDINELPIVTYFPSGTLKY